MRTPVALRSFMFLLVLASLPLWLLQGDYLQGIGVSAFVVAALAVSWNIIGGFGGKLSFGHGAFFGIGGYTSSLLLIQFGLSPWLGALVGMTLATVVALLLGILTLRLRGIYFTLATFVFTLMLLIVARHFQGFTGGDVGLSVPLLLENSPAMMQFDNQTTYYYMTLAMLIIYVAISIAVSRSAFGYRLRALRDDEDAARAVGTATTKVKLQAFALSAAMTSLVGTLATQHNLFMDPESAFGIDRSVEMVLGAIFGGIGTVWGPVIGGIAIVGITSSLNDILQSTVAGTDTIVYGLILILVASWLPGGLTSLPRRLSEVWHRRRQHVPSQESTSTNDRSKVSEILK